MLRPVSVCLQRRLDRGGRHAVEYDAGLDAGAVHFKNVVLHGNMPMDKVVVVRLAEDGMVTLS